MSKDNIPTHKHDLIPVSYSTWNDKSITKEALGHLNSAVAEYDSLLTYNSASASYGRSNFSNLLPSTSGRPGLTRRDYEAFRPGEAVPHKMKDILKSADLVYKNVGLIKNIVDLMGDFASQGVRLSHPDKRIEAFYRAWFKRVGGKDRSERFLNNLYKSANVIIRRQTANITLKDRANLFKTIAKVDIKKIDEEKVKPREIPWKYTFLNPCTVEVVGGAISSFTNIKAYAIALPEHIKRTIKNPKGNIEKKIVAKLPKEIIDAANSNGLVPLPEDKTIVFHYKKDDWQEWAFPMTHAIMDDIILLEKLKLADSAALDGAISNIRIFKLGSLEHKILPGPGAAIKLKNVLQNHVGAGTIDIVWGPDIELVESKTDVHKFLGQEKYIPTLNSIYGGIGIPPTLTGAFSTSGTTNNFISLKTLIQRLQYGRDVLTSFWDNEIQIIQKAMGFAEPASVEYDYPDLGDSDSEKALLIQMSDRNLISDELLQERFKHNTRLENSRISREEQERKNDERPAKAGPFYEAQPEVQLQRIALQSGQLAPEQIGMEFEGKSKDLAQVRAKPTDSAKKGIPQQGRPQGSKDTTKRKTKKFTPKTKASISIWASEAQEKISEVLNPGFLHTFGKKNMRSLTSEEYEMSEKIKLGVLFNIEPFTNLTNEYIIAKLSETVNKDAIHTANAEVKNADEDLGRKLTTKEIRQINTNIYTELYYDNNN